MRVGPHDAGATPAPTARLVQQQRPAGLQHTAPAISPLMILGSVK